ncbi:MAG: cadherin-like domain-containing protein, partial [Planctomycetota bacterium]
MKNTPRHRRRRRLRIECLDRRRVLASISGEVFLDDDHSFIRGQDEQGAASRIVYLDLDDSGNLSDGDPIQITDAAGQFEFADLSDGTYSVRVFDGAASQIQSSPVDASSLGVQAVSGIKQLVSGSGINSSPIAIVENLAADDTLALFDSDGNTTFYPVADSITDATILPGGLSGARRVLVIGEDTSGDSAWVVDLDGGAVTPVDLSGGQSDDGDGMAVSGPTIQWRQVVVDSDGNGLVLQDPSDLGGGDSPIRRISYDTNDGSFAVDVTNSVATDDTVVVSDDGPRSLLAAPTPGGWSYQLWSNQTGTPIAPPVVLSSTQMPLIFDDAKGLVLVDSANGFEVLDADAGFASIASANAGPSVVSYDPARSLVLAADVSNSMLKFFDFASLKPALETALDFTAIGAPIAVVPRHSASRFRVFGDMGVGTIALEDAAAVVRTIIGNADADGVSFGLKTLGSNTAPQYDEVPSFDVDEDDALELDAPALLDGASDLDGDSFVVLRQTEPGHGSIETSFDGSIRYTPDDDYFGSDSFSVVLSDGMTLSSSVTIQVSVNPMPDSPTGISVTVGTTREDISIGDAIGRVEIFDVDGPGTVGIDIDDGRFA